MSASKSGPNFSASKASASKASGSCLANQFLLAMPGMVDENFAGSVIYLFEHNAQGAMGLVINRPTEVTLLGLLDKIELKLEITPFADQSVYFGGPVQVDRGFVLHESDSPTDTSSSANPSLANSSSANSSYRSSLIVPGGLTMTTSKDILEDVAKGGGPKRFLMTLGYSGWSAGQLEEEIALNGWMNVALSRQQMTQIIFATPAKERYQRTMHAIGIDPSQLSGQVGHA